MDGMRKLERTVSVTLWIIGWISKEPVKFIGIAKSKFSACTVLLRRKLSDVNIDPERLLAGFDDTEPIQANVILGDALRQTKLLRAHHGKVHCLLLECIMYRRLHPGVRRRRWVEHHFTADQSAGKALMSLRIAVSFSRAAQEAFVTAGTFSEGSPSWVSWMRMAEQFWSSATGEAVEAWRQVVKMRHYVRMEFCEVWLILNDA